MERDTRMWRGWIKSREQVLPEILSGLGEYIPDPLGKGVQPNYLVLISQGGVGDYCSPWRT